MIKIKRKIWMPLLIWVALFLFIFNLANYFQPVERALMIAGYEIITSSFIYYFTALFLFPRYYKSGKSYLWISFLALTGISIALFLFDTQFIGHLREKEGDAPPMIFLFIRYYLSSGFVFFVATSIGLMKQTSKFQETEKLLTEEKLETELKLLKAQINPHFIFNALNNIYSLTYMQSKNAPDSVLKLSEMLRYVFYDCNKDRVPISAELKYIENFTAFQQMKSDFEQNIILKTDVNGANIEIAPMLFVPLIENAFKYSRIEESQEAYIAIEMKHLDSHLLFSIKNSIPESKPSSGSGMGIENVKHRLDIIYPGKYELEIDEQKDSYTVNLKLEV